MPLEDAEIDDLGLPAEVPASSCWEVPRRPPGGPGMDIFILYKRINQQGVFLNSAPDPKFDLGIIRGYHDPARLPG